MSGKYKTLSKREELSGLKSLTEYKAGRNSLSAAVPGTMLSTFKKRRDTMQTSSI